MDNQDTQKLIPTTLRCCLLVTDSKCATVKLQLLKILTTKSQINSKKLHLDPSHIESKCSSIHS